MAQLAIEISQDLSLRSGRPEGANVSVMNTEPLPLRGDRCARRDIDRGRGDVEFACVDGKTAVVRAQSNSPLRLHTPRSRGGCGWLFTSTCGGGLVDGDD